MLLGLLRPEVGFRDVAGHVTAAAIREVQLAFNAAGADLLLFDKGVFYDQCRGLGLESPELHALVEEGVAWTPAGDHVESSEDWRRFLVEDLPEDWLTKPARSDQGLDIVAAHREADGFVLTNGERHDADGLRRRLFGDGRKHVLQERVVAHPDLVELSGYDTVQSARVVTIVEGGGDVRVWAVALKIVCYGGLTDNFCGGASRNIFAVVDPESGVIRRGWHVPEVAFGYAPIDSHPETGRELTGFAVPLFEAVVNLARRAALAFRPYRAVGWDIAISPDGPKLLEGNSGWGGQAPDKPYLDRAGLEELRGLL